MNEINIEVTGGSTTKLLTAGKYCDRNIVVTALAGGGGGGTPMWIPYITSCMNMFDTVTFPENTELVIELQTIDKGFNYMFRNAKNVTSVKLIADGGNTTPNSAIYIFASPSIQQVDLSEFNAVVCNWINAFYGATSLEEIIGVLRCKKQYSGQNFSNAFYMCGNLREVRFAEGTIFENCTFSSSKLLSDDSIQSIIDGLFDLTGATAQTLTFHADVGAKLTDAQKATITAKNWTLVY